MVCQSKKRVRSFSPSTKMSYQAAEDEFEYERAVSFLQEFHSQRVASLNSTRLNRLDVINEDFDDLAEDFSIALNVDSRRGPLNTLCNTEPSRLRAASKMKKTSTFNCLTSLVASSEDDTPSLQAASSQNDSDISSHTTRSSVKKCEFDVDDNLVYCNIGGSPIAKRHRGALWTTG